MQLDFTRLELWLAVATFLLSIWIWTTLKSTFRRFTLQRRFARAAAAEEAASRLLRERGFDVIGAQVEGGYSLLVDGQEFPVALRADYVVSRNGKTFIAEVKSGSFAPRLSTASTRRQLLEYRTAFDVDGVLLVDGESERVLEVVFPTPRQSETAPTTPWLIASVFGLLLLAAWFLLR